MGRRKLSKNTFSAGSALILAVVLTSLLAIVGTIFLMAARVDKIATSAIAEHRDLDSAVEALIARISRELALDVPDMPKGDDYYDYPGGNDRWLASLEPYDDGTTYRWRQISDVYDKFVNQELDAEIIHDYQDSSDVYEGEPADADGDGVADSKWIELEDMTSAKGKRIYAAVRVIDNGGMINVNTAHDFDRNASIERVDGSSLSQINLAALRRGVTEPFSNLHRMREGRETWDLDRYMDEVVSRIEKPDGLWTPFDISDELKLRSRYIINKTSIDTRISNLWTKAFDWAPYVPRNEADDHDIDDANDWFWYANNSSSDVDDYDYRHIATTSNMDRIIDPCGVKMFNINDVNSANVDDVYRTIRDALDDANFADANDVAAQLAVNLIDYRDGPNEPEITTYTARGKTYYGFESPCIYISELAHRWLVDPAGGGPVGSDTFRSYAVELYKPYGEDAEPNSSNQWRLFIDNSSASPPGNEVVDIDWADGANFHVIRWHNPSVELDVDAAASSFDKPNTYNKIFDAGSVISLERRIQGGGGGGGNWVAVDSLVVPGSLDVNGGWLMPRDGTALGIQRDIQLHKCIRRLWSDKAYTPTLGEDNDDYRTTDSIYIQAHPADRKFTNVGEIGRLFRKDVYVRDWNDTDTEADVRLNLAVPALQEILNYFTRFDPTVDGIDNDGDGKGETEADSDELKIPGRININTAPWYVLGQLPWMLYEADSTTYDRARAIADDRQTKGPFENIAGLMRVSEMLSLGSDDVDNLNTDSPRGPDLTDDTCQDDFEERDVIFARISDLVTVRSDVFTAYILVRIGIDGPQKRVIAVLDRSNVYSPGDKVKVAALHPVPDPR